MQKFNFVLVMLAIALVFGLVFAACDNGTMAGDTLESMTYSGTINNVIYTLTISPAPGRAAHLEGDDYVLVVERGDSEKTSAGKVTDVNESVFVLQPSVESAPSFIVATSEMNIVNISGTITFKDSTSEAGPGSITADSNQGGNSQGGNNQGNQGGNDQGGHTHSWGAWTVTTSATCTGPGVETRVCSQNRSHTETRIIATLGHDWGEWAVTSAATETQAGVETRTCARDSSHKETRDLPWTGVHTHVWGEWTVTTAPTETQDGTETRTCAIISSHKETRTLYATGTPGLSFYLINNGAAFSVSKGTVTNGAVHIPAWQLRVDSNSEYLPVTEIGTFGGTNITSVSIPSSVMSISRQAFSQCESLTSVTLPPGLTSIEQGLFLFCKNLASVTIPTGVTSIGDSAFSGCASLTSIVIPSSGTSVGAGAFSFCTSLTSIIIPSSVTAIGGQAFQGCTGLKSVTIPSSVTVISIALFQDCTGLTSVTLSEGVTSIERWAFGRCTSLTSINLPSSLRSIGENAFFQCTSVSTLTIPAGVTSIGEGGGAFQGWTSSQTINVMGYSSWSAANAAWGDFWWSQCNAVINYRG